MEKRHELERWSQVAYSLSACPSRPVSSNGPEHYGGIDGRRHALRGLHASERIDVPSLEEVPAPSLAEPVTDNSLAPVSQVELAAPTAAAIAPEKASLGSAANPAAAG